MDTKTRWMGRKGVSPVIATILLIAVTVIMAGILATFVFTQGSQLESKPLVSLIARDQPNTSTYLVLKHSGGDAVDWADLRISVTIGADSATLFEDPTKSENALGAQQAAADDFIAGESVIIDAESNGDSLVEDTYYHVAVMHEPSGTTLLDVNVQVTSA